MTMTTTNAPAWFPRVISTHYIPSMRNYARRASPKRSHNPDGKPALDIQATPITLHERQLLTIFDSSAVFTIGKILADGPKLFRIPPDIIANLNAIEIPLNVDEYCQPFPAVIVYSGNEYHYCWHESGKGLIIGTFEGRTWDWLSISSCNQTIEDVFTNGANIVHNRTPMPDGRIACWSNDTDQDINAPHRFRATLNFLLLVTAGGFQLEHQPTGRKKSKPTGPARYAIPTIFVPQDIALVRSKLAEATKPVGSAMGSKKRPHWRRAHWRRVAVGVGRTGRELRLIAASLINKKLLTVDPGDSNYMVSMCYGW